MPVFGKSLFETVLDGLESPAEDEDELPMAPIRGLNSGFVAGLSGFSDEPGSDPGLRFDDFAPDPAPAVPETPSWAGRVTEAEIAADLAIETCASAEALKERRRIFALANHPDRVPDDYRRQATRRMMVANQMIDAALASRG